MRLQTQVAPEIQKRLHQIHQIIQLLMRKVINFKGKQGFLSG